MHGGQLQLPVPVRYPDLRLPRRQRRQHAQPLVLAPLLAATLISSWLLIFLLSVQAVSLPLLLVVANDFKARTLPELIELRLVTLRGRRVWRLKQADGQALLVPVDAAGAEGLFDAFAILPGMDTAALVAAIRSRLAATRGCPGSPGTRTLDRRNPECPRVLPLKPEP